LFPKLCTTSYRWSDDWLVCEGCGEKLGFKYILPDTCLDYDRNTGQIIYRDNSETRIMLFRPYINKINKESIKFERN
jgi:hypothetical protein